MAGNQDENAESRDQKSERRDEGAHRRDGLATLRDDAGNQRDVDAHVRDDLAVARDLAGDRRDAAAEARDRLAERSGADASVHATGRHAAAADRALASIDRNAGAHERDDAEGDRAMAAGDRGASASERSQSESDRETSLADRDFSATDRESASVDGLTGVYVRAPGLIELQRELDRAQRTGQHLVFAFVDVDGLKAVNDARGHAGGDKLLRAVADALRAKLRSYDRIVRFGGDEFVCALPGLSVADAAKRFELVNVALAAGAEHGSISVGFADHESGDTLEVFIARSDAALYKERQRKRTARRS